MVAMKFQCEKCGTRYAANGGRTGGKPFKFRCKNCQHLIRVGGSPRTDPALGMAAAAAGAAGRAAGPTREITGEIATPVSISPAPSAAIPAAVATPDPAAAVARSAPKPGPERAEWFLSFDGDGEGPHTLTTARRRLLEDPRRPVHVMKDSFADWVPVDQVPELASTAPALQAVPAPAPAEERTRPSDDPAPLPAPAPPEPAAASTPRAPALDEDFLFDLVEGEPQSRSLAPPSTNPTREAAAPSSRPAESPSLDPPAAQTEGPATA